MLPKARLISSFKERAGAFLMDLFKNTTFWVVVGILLVFAGGTKACMCNIESNAEICQENMRLGEAILIKTGFRHDEIICTRGNVGVRDIIDFGADEPNRNPDAICYASRDRRNATLYCREGNCEIEWR